MHHGWKGHLMQCSFASPEVKAKTYIPVSEQRDKHDSSVCKEEGGTEEVSLEHDMVLMCADERLKTRQPREAGLMVSSLLCHKHEELKHLQTQESEAWNRQINAPPQLFAVIEQEFKHQMMTNALKRFWRGLCKACVCWITARRKGQILSRCSWVASPVCYMNTHDL
eukprot:4103763-Amphidinium_carterae.1